MHRIAWWPTMAPTLVVLAIATITDLRSRRIPNWLVFPYMVAGIGVSTWLNGWRGLWESLGGLALGLVVYGIFAAMGGMGMGDVKLCAAIGAWIWWKQLVFALVMIAVVGGVMALLWALVGGFLGELFTGAGDLMFNWKNRKLKAPEELTLANPKAHKMPYAPAIAIGTLISFFSR